jgi:predicted O-methyltransferase YrrM
VADLGWQQINEYLGSLFYADDDALTAAQRDSVAAGLPQISISPAEGRLLHLLAGAIGARRILEVGTLAGYSTIWLARALPEDGRLVSLELEQRHADVARRNLERAGVADRVKILVGPALDSLAQLAQREREPFDMAFIDADKESYPEYLEWSLRLCRSGGLIVADNVIRHGAITDPASPDPRVAATRRFLEAVSADARLEAAVIPSPEPGGFDGMAVVRIR